MEPEHRSTLKQIDEWIGQHVLAYWVTRVAVNSRILLMGNLKELLVVCNNSPWKREAMPIDISHM